MLISAIRTAALKESLSGIVVSDLEWSAEEVDDDLIHSEDNLASWDSWDAFVGLEGLENLAGLDGFDGVGESVSGGAISQSKHNKE